MARPIKNPADRRNLVLQMCVTETERMSFEQYAYKLGLDTTTWARAELLRIIRQNPLN